ncbi:ATP-binding protein [Azospirillum sp. SYSU D00513]|uniref:sensor histidine kinase n=1 Tax=Azospirillum sp. SYSU D00513 TaxID=2812561 RepID=UPI001A95E1D8|nr:ATP-binding protein [Azospirillum sp. SYSU D00513]
MRRLPQAPTLILAAALGLVAVQAVATWQIIERDRIDEEESAGQLVQRSLAVAEANFNRGILQVDAMLAGINKLVPIPSEGRPVAPTNQALYALADQSLLTRDLFILAEQGKVRAARRQATIQRPPQLPESFNPDRLEHGTLRIEGPIRNRSTGEWSLYVGRRVPNAQGEGLTAVAELPLENLTRLMVPGSAGAGFRVLVQRDDGQLLMSVPHAQWHIGKPLLRAAQRLPVERKWAHSADPMDDSLVIAAAAPTLYQGITVTAEIEKQDALAVWRNRVMVTVAISGTLALVLLGGAVTGALYIRARDRAAAETRRSKHLLDQALNSMSEGFVLWDADRRLVLANPRYYDMFPHLRGIIEPGRVFDALVTQAAVGMLPEGSEEERAAWVAHRKAVHEQLKTFEQETVEGTVVECTQARTPDGYVVSVYRDVTLRRRVEARLEEAKEAAERAHRLKSEFLANMSHELRTPLTAIIGFAQVLEASDPTRDKAMALEYARDIRAGGENLLSIIDAVLIMSKLESRTMGIREDSFDLGQSVRDWARSLSEQALAADLTLEIACGQEFFPCRGDRHLLKQAVLNILTNALKFSLPGGRIMVEVRRADGGYEIVVADTGIGIAADKLPHVFDAFYQVESAATRCYGGTGLGLSISLAIVTLHEGAVVLQSEPGKGTTARIRLPAQRSTAPSRESSRNLALMRSAPQS